jgi:tetratricopeptide (TPR) repeat protein
MHLKAIQMQNFLFVFLQLLSVLLATEIADMNTDMYIEEDSQIEVCHAAAQQFLIKNREAFKVAALDGEVRDFSIQTHSYAISENEFKKSERVVLRGRGEVKDWVAVGLSCRYGIPDLEVQRSSDEALRILFQPAEVEGDISAIFHIASMVADDMVRGYWKNSGNAALLTVMLEIDQQTLFPVLERLQYKQALRRIVSSVPNARACLALAQCTDEERFPLTALRYYQKALELEPENVDAFFGAGTVVNNGCRDGIVFPENTPSAVYYFGEAYKRDKLLSGNYYGCVLYERATITIDKNHAFRDFVESLAILESSVAHDQDALLSLADYHATEHEAKPASFAKSFECIKNYMQYKYIDRSKVIEVIENLKTSMTRLGQERSNLFDKITRFQMRWLS